MQTMEEQTRALGAALQLCPEYVRMVAAREQNDADEALQAQMQEIELVRMQYQRAMQKSGAPAEPYQSKFDTLYSVIMQNPHMAEYQSAADALNALLQRVTGILAGCANGEDPATYEPKQSCGGDCGGCKGCQ